MATFAEQQKLKNLLTYVLRRMYMAGLYNQAMQIIQDVKTEEDKNNLFLLVQKYKDETTKIHEPVESEQLNTLHTVSTTLIPSSSSTVSTESTPAIAHLEHVIENIVKTAENNVTATTTTSKVIKCSQIVKRTNNQCTYDAVPGHELCRRHLTESKKYQSTITLDFNRDD